MGWNEELVEYIDYIFEQLGELKKGKEKEIRVPSDLYCACLSVTRPTEECVVEDEFMDMKKNDVINMVVEAHTIIHGLD